MNATTANPNPSTESSPLDLSEKGQRNGQQISLDRRLFMKFTAFGGCHDASAAIKALAASGVDGALYLDSNDPQGIGSSVDHVSIPPCPNVVNIETSSFQNVSGRWALKRRELQSHR